MVTYSHVSYKIQIKNKDKWIVERHERLVGVHKK